MIQLLMVCRGRSFGIPWFQLSWSQISQGPSSRNEGITGKENPFWGQSSVMQSIYTKGLHLKGSEFYMWAMYLQWLPALIPPVCTCTTLLHSLCIYMQSSLCIVFLCGHWFDMHACSCILQAFMQAAILRKIWITLLWLWLMMTIF